MVVLFFVTPFTTQQYFFGESFLGQSLFLFPCNINIWEIISICYFTLRHLFPLSVVILDSSEESTYNFFFVLSIILTSSCGGSFIRSWAYGRISSSSSFKFLVIFSKVSNFSKLSSDFPFQCYILRL